MNYIDIKEKFKIDDSHSNVRGVVCAYDENNDLVFAKENMIVAGGRKYIMTKGIQNDSFVKAFITNNGTTVTPDDDFVDSLVINNETIKISYKYTNYSLKKDEMDIEVENNGFENIKVDSKFIEDYKPEDPDVEDNFLYYYIDESQLCIKCLIIFNDISEIEAKSLGLVVNDGTNDIMFSRVTFPAYYKSRSQRLTFKYYIYF